MPQKIKHLLEYSSALYYPSNIVLNFLKGKLHFDFRKDGPGRINRSLIDTGGYDGFELGLWSGGFFNKNWEVNSKNLRLFKKSHIRFPRFHGCFELFPPTFKSVFFNLARKGPWVEKALKSQIRVAAELRSVEHPIIIFHPGLVLRLADKDRGINQVKENLAKALDFAKAEGVILTLENMFWLNRLYYLGANIDELIDIIDTIDSPYLKITFDWGHLNSFIRSKKIPNNFEYIDRSIIKLGKRIIHAHIHYNHSHERSFQPEKTFGRRIVRKISRWSKTFNFVTVSLGDDFDSHLPFTRIRPEHRLDFARNFINLINNTSIKDFGYITHEISPRKIFYFVSVQKEGAEENDYRQSIKFLNQILDEKTSN